MAQRYENLQALRGLATITIVLANLYPIEWESFGSQWIPRVLIRFEPAALDLLFIISGFVVTTRCRNEKGGGRAAMRFLLRRAWRVYPLYWLAIAATVLPRLHGEPDVAPWSLSEVTPWQQLGLLHATADVADRLLPPQMRALSTGLYCYVVFALLIAILGSKRLVAGLLLWTALIYFGRLLADVDEPWPGLLFGFTTLEFIGGALAAKAMEDEVTSIPAIFALVAGLLFVAMPWTLGLGSWQQTRLARNSLCFCVIGILAVWCLTSLERVVGAKAPRCLSAIGDASYPLWLFHVVTATTTAKTLTHWIDPARLTSLGIVVCLAMTMIVGWLCHRFVEVPLLGASRGRAFPRVEPQT